MLDLDSITYTVEAPAPGAVIWIGGCQQYLLLGQAAQRHWITTPDGEPTITEWQLTP